MKKELLIKYLNNQCSEPELNEVLNWFKTEALSNEGNKLSLEIWHTLPESNTLNEDEDFIAIFEKIQERIDNNKSEEKKGKLIPLIFNWTVRVAAILLLPALTFLFYIVSENNIKSERYANLASDTLEVAAPLGSKTTVMLSDGSEVQLNHGSKIKYPHFFSGNSRDVILSGEGFFKIAHNPQKPFIVKAKSVNVKAVGTIFNVSAYPGNDIIETTLVSGKVILEQVKKDGQIRNIGSMKPGLHVSYDMQSGSVKSNEGSIEEYIAWTEGKLIFNDTPIVDVIGKLGVKFNVDFEVKDNIKNYRYTVTFSDDPLFQILDLMAIATPITYKILPREKLPDGTYSKQKIILEQR